MKMLALTEEVLPSTKGKSPAKTTGKYIDFCYLG